MGDRKSSIYTRTGDTGETSLFNGDRKSKDEDYFDALGTTDECSSWIGMADSLCSFQGLENPDENELKECLSTIQKRLLDIGSHVATPLTRSGPQKVQRTSFNPDDITVLEKMIDRMDAQLPKLTTFILPAGVFHMCRVVARRAERAIVPLVRRGDCSDAVLRYMNRLSDFLFVLARYTSQEEVRYKKSRVTPFCNSV